MSGGAGARRPPVELLAVLALVTVTAVWGSTFFMLKGVVTRVPVPDFLAVRFWVAALLLWAVRPRSVGRLDARARWHGVWLGAAYGGGQLVQTFGLERTSASVSGFVTGMYVVITPLLAAPLLHRRVQPVTWAAVALATAGLAVLSLHGVALGAGETLTLVSAALYALHIIGLAAWSTTRDAYGLTVVQMLTIAVICTVTAVPGGVTLPSRTADWAVLAYMATLSGAGAVLLQTWAQVHLPPTRAAIVMTLEPVWAGGFAITLGDEGLGPRLLIGGALSLTAMFTAELGPNLSEALRARSRVPGKARRTDSEAQA
jgi:drug/metabolite transporter (DMT)-like permease